jgi:hypothetical protein
MSLSAYKKNGRSYNIANKIHGTVFFKIKKGFYLGVADDRFPNESDIAGGRT